MNYISREQRIRQYNTMHNTIEYFLHAFTSDMDGKDNQYYLQQFHSMLSSPQINLRGKRLGNKLIFASRVDLRKSSQGVKGLFDIVIVFTVSNEQINKVDIYSVTEIGGARNISKRTVTVKADFVEESHPSRLPNHYVYMISDVHEGGGHSHDER